MGSLCSKKGKPLQVERVRKTRGKVKPMETPRKVLVAKGYPISDDPNTSDKDILTQVTDAALALNKAIYDLIENQVVYNLSQNEQLLNDFVRKLIDLSKYPGNENYDIITMRTHKEFSQGDYIKTHDGNDLYRIFVQPVFTVLNKFIPNRVETVLQEERNCRGKQY